MNHWHNVTGMSDMDITGFGLQKGKLTVVFDHKGKKSVYIYTTNEENMCCRWILAESIGQFFHRCVKPLPYAKVA